VVDVPAMEKMYYNNHTSKSKMIQKCLLGDFALLRMEFSVKMINDYIYIYVLPSGVENERCILFAVLVENEIKIYQQK
jgi:hypothetical protein